MKKFVSFFLTVLLSFVLTLATLARSAPIESGSVSLKFSAVKATETAVSNVDTKREYLLNTSVNSNARRGVNFKYKDFDEKKTGFSQNSHPLLN